jgi:FixJ family two-component response regulator
MANPPLISVVDDDNSVRESIQSLMRSLGFAVKVFASAEEFLNWDHLRDTDCLILDVRLPGMTGIELQRRLVASHFEMPIIFVTAHASDEEMRSLALRNGAVAYLAKPLSEESLLSAVQSALNGGRDNRQSKLE